MFRHLFPTKHFLAYLETRQGPRKIALVDEVLHHDIDHLKVSLSDRTSCFEEQRFVGATRNIATQIHFQRSKLKSLH